MDCVRTFEETDLTKDVLEAIKICLWTLRSDSYVFNNKTALIKKLDELQNSISNYKLDVRLVSREY